MFSRTKTQGAVSDLLDGQILRREELICRKELLEMMTDKEGGPPSPLDSIYELFRAKLLHCHIPPKTSISDGWWLEMTRPFRDSF